MTPEVIEDRHQRRDEDDDGQHLERDQHAGGAGTEHAGDLAPRVRVGERTEDERGADAAEADEAVEAVSERREQRRAGRRLEDEQREDDLKAESPGDGAERDRPPVGREDDTPGRE